MGKVEQFKKLQEACHLIFDVEQEYKEGTRQRTELYGLRCHLGTFNNVFLGEARTYKAIVEQNKKEL